MQEHECMHCLTRVSMISATWETQAMCDQYMMSRGSVRVSSLHMPKVNNRWWVKLMISVFLSQSYFWEKLVVFGLNCIWTAYPDNTSSWTCRTSQIESQGGVCYEEGIIIMRFGWGLWRKMCFLLSCIDSYIWWMNPICIHISLPSGYNLIHWCALNSDPYLWTNEVLNHCNGN